MGILSLYHLCCPKGICLNGFYSLCGQIQGMGPSRKISLNSSSLCQSVSKYLCFWFVSDFNDKVFPSFICLHLIFLHKIKGGTHKADLSLCAEKLQFIEWGKGWKSKRAGSAEWIEGECVRWIQLSFTSSWEQVWFLSIISGPGLLPHQDREVLSSLETIFASIEPRVGDLFVWRAGDQLSDFVLFFQRFMVTPFG